MDRRKREKALAQLEDDYGTTDMVHEDYVRERRRITQGDTDSPYVRDQLGLIARVAAGDTAAIIKLGLIIMTVLILLAIAGSVFDALVGIQGGEIDD